LRKRAYLLGRNQRLQGLSRKKERFSGEGVLINGASEVWALSPSDRQVLRADVTGECVRDVDMYDHSAQIAVIDYTKEDFTQSAQVTNYFVTSATIDSQNGGAFKFQRVLSGIESWRG